MIDMRKFLIGIFFSIPTCFMIYLAYLCFFEMNDLHLGIISLFATFMLGAMTIRAFIDAFKEIITDNRKEKNK